MTLQKKILVAEDDPVLRNILIEKLNAHGYDARPAKDGVEALKELKMEAYSLLLLDIIMPNKDGIEVLEEMSKTGMIKAVPVIIVSNSGQPVEIEKAKSLGAIDFLIKTSFDPADVLKRVNAVLWKAGTPEIEKPPAKTYSTIKPIMPNDNTTKNILLIEDDKFLRELLASKLLSEGYALDTAVDGKEAIEKLSSTNPALVLLDLLLPDINGFEVLEKMRKDEKTKNIPVIVLSNLDQKADLDRASALGVIDFMIKANFSLTEIVARIKKELQ